MNRTELIEQIPEQRKHLENQHIIIGRRDKAGVMGIAAFYLSGGLTFKINLPITKSSTFLYDVPRHR